MDSNIYLKAIDLAKSIAESVEAEALKRAEQQIRNDQVANQLAKRWQKVYDRIAELKKNGQPLTEQDERSIELIEAKVENHPVILEFIDAHQKFQVLLQQVNDILNGALDFETSEEENGCITCPSKGQCSIN